MAGAAGQAGDADSSWAPRLTSGLQGSVNVHRGALLLVPQWQCISSFVFYTYVLSIKVKEKANVMNMLSNKNIVNMIGKYTILLFIIAL